MTPLAKWLILAVAGAVISAAIVLWLQPKWESRKRGRPERNRANPPRCAGAGAEQTVWFLKPIVLPWRLLTRDLRWVWVAAVVLLALAATWALQSPAAQKPAVDFHPSVTEGSRKKDARSFAAPTVDTVLWFHVRLTLRHQDLDDVLITLKLPETLELTGACFVHAPSGSGHCTELGDEAFVEVGHLSAGQSVQIVVQARCIHGIDGQEAVPVEMNSSETDRPNREAVTLYRPPGSSGEEAAATFFNDEVSRGPTRWDGDSMETSETAFEELGAEWRLLDPLALHGIGSVPYGRRVPVRSLLETRLIAAKLITIRAVLSSDPLLVQRLEVRRAGDGVEVAAVREIFTIGTDPGSRLAVCTTTRGTAQQPLRRGEPVLVRAAVVGWGEADLGGSPFQAAMLICPAVRRATRAAAAPPFALAPGGTTAPANQHE